MLVNSENENIRLAALRAIDLVECEFYRRTMNSTENWREVPGRPAYALGGVPKVAVT